MADDEHLGGPAGPAVAGRASLRVIALAAALVVASAAVLSQVDVHPQLAGGPHLHWWGMALLAVAAELMVFHIEFRREFCSFTFSEIPLVVGLFLATPADLIIGRLLGELLFLTVKERQPARKLMLNLASFLGECTALLAVYQLLGQSRDAHRPAVWAAAFVSVMAGMIVGYFVISLAIRWHGGLLRFRSIFAIGALTAPVNTGLALLAVILAGTQPWAVLLLTSVAAFVILAYRSYSALSQRFESLSMLYDFTRLVSGAQTPEVVLEAILSEAKELFRAERAVIWIADAGGAMFELSVTDDGRATHPLGPDRSSAEIAAWFEHVDDALVVRTTSSDQPGRTVADALEVRDCIAAPITESGAVVGVIAVAHRLGEMNEFRNAEGPMFATLANHASVALENGRLIERLHDEARRREHESLHDALTGLPNRVLFGERLRAALDGLGPGESCAVALMDLDGFKDVNDALGHHAGDLVLVEVARRVSAAISRDILLARLGGDEFALLVPPGWTHDELERCARTIRGELREPMSVDGVRATLSISVGFSVGPRDGQDASTLLQRADVAMYEAKTGVGDGVCFYTPTNDTNTRRKLALASDLAAAVEHDEITLMFQPKVRIADGVVLGAECLARWRHPLFGPVPPDEFIPMAERTGSMLQLTEHVVRHALDQAAEWQRGGRPWSVSINLSMRNLLDSDLVPTVGRLLDASGVTPAAITLEITETSVMSDPVRTVRLLHALAELGVCLSIDDFGTGYSSLSYLQQLPVHEVKIDKTFVTPMTGSDKATVIVRSILDLARHMSLAVVAEGVEDRATWDHLRRLGCQAAQGYFLSRPVPAGELEHWADELDRLHLVDELGYRSITADGRPRTRERATSSR